MVAIQKAAESLLVFAGLGEITIYAGSPTALRTLDNNSVSSKTVLATMLTLDRLALANHYPVKLAWSSVAKHSEGNLIATALATEGSMTDPTDPEPTAPVTKGQLSKVVDEEVLQRWNRRWQNLTTARQSRELWPSVDKLKSLLLVRLNRQEYGEILRLLTGHNYLNRHSYLLQEAESARCRLCHDAEETSHHLLCECPALNDERIRILGSDPIAALALSQLPLDGTRRFTILMRRRLSQEGLDQI
jgi:hypothetical protein